MTSKDLNDRRIDITSDLSQIGSDCLMFVNRNEKEKDLANFKEVLKVRSAIFSVMKSVDLLFKEVESSIASLENEIRELKRKQDKLKLIAKLECELKHLKESI